MLTAVIITVENAVEFFLAHWNVFTSVLVACSWLCSVVGFTEVKSRFFASECFLDLWIFGCLLHEFFKTVHGLWWNAFGWFWRRKSFGIGIPFVGCFSTSVFVDGVSDVGNGWKEG